MIYTVVDRLVYQSNNNVTLLVGSEICIETVRIDDNTVADVTYQFDISTGQYVEQSRTERVEPIPKPEPTPADKIATLEKEAALLALELVDTQTRLQQSENDHAALLLELVDKGVI